jgi:hypothetical protein
MKFIKLRNGSLKLEASAHQIEDDRRRLRGLLDSYERASKTLEKNAALLAESRRLIFEAEKLLGTITQADSCAGAQTPRH